MKAVWNGKTVAESTETIVIEGNHYFPPQSLDQSVMVSSETTSVCGWKGTASYWSLNVEGKINTDATPGSKSTNSICNPFCSTPHMAPRKDNSDFLTL